MNPPDPSLYPVTPEQITDLQRQAPPVLEFFCLFFVSVFFSSFPVTVSRTLAPRSTRESPPLPVPLGLWAIGVLAVGVGRLDSRRDRPTRPPFFARDSGMRPPGCTIPELTRLQAPKTSAGGARRLLRAPWGSTPPPATTGPGSNQRFVRDAFGGNPGHRDNRRVRGPLSRRSLAADGEAAPVSRPSRSTEHAQNSRRQWKILLLPFPPLPPPPKHERRRRPIWAVSTSAWQRTCPVS